MITLASSDIGCLKKSLKKKKKKKQKMMDEPTIQPLSVSRSGDVFELLGDIGKLGAQKHLDAL